MAKNNNLHDFLTDIANIIREKTGTTEPINPQDFGAKIAGIGGGDNFRKLVSGTLTELKASDLQGIHLIKPYAFYYDDSIKSVSIPNSVTSIGMYAFEGCSKLTSVTIGSGVTRIRNDAFSSCTNLTSVTLGNSVTNIENYAFYRCRGLTSVTIPNSVTSIGRQTFYSCSGLTSVTIPYSVTSVDEGAFVGCTGLTCVKFMGQPPAIKSNTFNSCNNVAKYDFRGATSVPTLSSTTSLGHAIRCQIVVPDSLYDSWQQATNWAALTDVVWVKASEYAEE